MSMLEGRLGGRGGCGLGGGTFFHYYIVSYLSVFPLDLVLFISKYTYSPYFKTIKGF